MKAIASGKNRINGNGHGTEAVAPEEAPPALVRPGQVAKITAPNFQTAAFRIVGTAPYVQNRFGKKAMEIMKGIQEAGSVSRKGKKKEPKNFAALYQEAMHQVRDDTGGWCGIPASAFRAAMISACRVVDFKMTLGKLSLFVEADGFDAEGFPLVKITKGQPHHVEHAVRLQGTTTDIRVRAMWDPGWEAEVRIRYDADLFGLVDVANLLHRVGAQVGVGEGRPDSRTSCGMGWGLFSVASE